ncbi:unnamed protein product, partial [Polarella glacialis]
VGAGAAFPGGASGLLLLLPLLWDWDWDWGSLWEEALSVRRVFQRCGGRLRQDGAVGARAGPRGGHAPPAHQPQQHHHQGRAPSSQRHPRLECLARSARTAAGHGNGAAGNGAQHVVAHVRLQECNGAAEMRISAASRASSGHWQLHQSKAQGSEESPPPATSFFPKSASCASASASAVQGEGLRFANLQSPLPLPLLRQEVEKGRTGGPPHRPPTPLHQPQLQFQLRQPEGSPFLGGGEREGDEAETETTAEAPSQPSTSSSPPASASGVGVMNPKDAELLSVLWTCQAAGLWQEALAVLRSLEAVASLPSARPALSSETAETAAPQRLLTETYTAVMSACEASGEWALALSLLSDALHAQGGSLVPSAMSDIIMSFGCS